MISKELEEMYCKNYHTERVYFTTKIVEQKSACNLDILVTWFEKWNLLWLSIPKYLVIISLAFTL